MQLLEPGAFAQLKKIFIWLLPAEPARADLAGLLSRLAERFGGPHFEPHLTVHSSFLNGREPPIEEVLAEAARARHSLTLPCEGLDFSSHYNKSCFLRFALSAELRELSRQIAKSLGAPETPLDPHLSLFYGTLEGRARDEIRREVPSLSKVSFDLLWAVGAPLSRSIGSSDDVEQWRLVAGRELL